MQRRIVLLLLTHFLLFSSALNGQGFAPGPFFVDDFEDGDLGDDSPVSWRQGVWDGATVSAQDGKLAFEVTNGTNFFGPAHPNFDWMTYENSSVQATFRMEGGSSTDWMMLTTRVPDLRMYAVFYRANGSVDLRELDNSGFSQIKTVVQTDLDATSHDVTLRVDAWGDYVRGWAWEAGTEMPTEPFGEFVDSTLADGTVGLIVGGTGRFEFSDFQVSEITEPPYREIGGKNAFGQVKLDGQQTDTTYRTVEGTQPGLLQHWFSIRGPSTYDRALDVFDPNFVEISESPDVPAFQTPSTWWHGSRPNIEGLPSYPPDLVGTDRNHQNAGDIWGTQDNANYTTYLEGEIFLPESGTYRFLDGVDDFAALGIDLDRNGRMEGDELLIDDNEWTDTTRTLNDGGHEAETIPSVQVSNVGESGEWFPIQVVVGERGGLDSGVFYWDYDAHDLDGDGIRIGDASGFPVSVNGDGRTIVEEDIPRLLIPSSHLRASGASEIESGTATAQLSPEIPGYELEIGSDEHDQIVVQRTNEKLTTRLDLAGATLAISAIGDVAPGEYQLLSADEILGDAELVIPEELGGSLDTSKLLTDGVLIVLGSDFDCDGDGTLGIADLNCLPASDAEEALSQLGLLRGDIDGDADVDFADFLALSTNFGEPGSYTDGDLDKNGSVEFADFLMLSANFGNTPQTTSVPEPSSTLLGLVSTLGFRNRRSVHASGWRPR